MEKYEEIAKEITSLRDGIVNGSVHVKTLYDFEKLKQKALQLKEEYAKSISDLGKEIENPESMSLLNCQKFIRLLTNCLLHVEDKYNSQIPAHRLGMIMENLTIVCTYHTYTYSMNEILAHIEFDKENPVLGMPLERIKTTTLKDPNGKQHFVSLYYEKEFITLVESQKKLTSKYTLAKSFILSKNHQETNKNPYIFYQEVNEEIGKHKQGFLYGNFDLKTLAGWQAFVSNVLELNKKYEESTQKAGEKMGVSSFPNLLKNKEYIHKLTECIEKISINFQEGVTEADLPIIMDSIRKICEWTDINAGLDEIETRAKTTKDTGSVIILQDYFKHHRSLKTNEQVEFKQLVERQSARYASYVQASEFIFGVTEEENLVVKK